MSKTCLLLMRLPWRLVYTSWRSSLTSYGMSCLLISHPFMAHYPLGLGCVWLWAFPHSAHSFVLFCSLAFPAIPFATPAMMLFDPSLLGLFGSTAHSPLNDSMWSFRLCIALLMGSFVPFISFWASLASLLSVGFLGPFPNSAFSWAFTNSFRLSWPNYLIFHP